MIILDDYYTGGDYSQDSWWGRNKNKVIGGAALVSALAAGNYIGRHHSPEGIAGSLVLNGKMNNLPQHTAPQQTAPQKAGDFAVSKNGGLVQNENLPKHQVEQPVQTMHTMNHGIIQNPQNSGVWKNPDNGALIKHY